jgi:uncharacterized protein (TIGR00251 family)
VLIYLTVHPEAKKNRITKIDEKAVHIDIKAAPKGGEANAALFEFFSTLLVLPLSSFVLKKGHTSHKKILLIKNCTVADIVKKIIPYS